jgi:hypothetical protein
MDVIHTPATARKAARLIPNSELHEDVVEKYPDDNLLKDWDRKGGAKPNPGSLRFSAFARAGSLVSSTVRSGRSCHELADRRVVTGHRRWPPK